MSTEIQAMQTPSTDPTTAPATDPAAAPASDPAKVQTAAPTADPAASSALTAPTRAGELVAPTTITALLALIWTTVATARSHITALTARSWRILRRRLASSERVDAGMSTVEYAVGTIAAAAFGAVLYTVVSGDSIPDALGGIIEQALTTSV